jgi:subtilisin family serine protease
MESRSVISVSMEGPFSDIENKAVSFIVDRGIPVIMAAGNGDSNVMRYSPASAAKAITVVMTDLYDNRAGFPHWGSNWGSKVDVFAPGVGILSASHHCTTCYEYHDGTSAGMLSPLLRGLEGVLIK